MSEEKINERSHLSFSELYLFESCPYKHYKTYILKERSPDGIHAVFGKAVHQALEDSWRKNSKFSWITMGKMISLFCRFSKIEDSNIWTKEAFALYKNFFPWLKETFPNCEIVDFEYKLEEPISGYNRNFLGYIDLILYDKSRDIYHILDLKTSKSGWFRKAKSDTKKLYQVILYKNFYAIKNKIPLKNIECHYVLLIRQPSKKLKHGIELFPVTSGNIKVRNAVDWMETNVTKLKAGIKIKNPLGCNWCICEYNKRK